MATAIFEFQEVLFGCLVTLIWPSIFLCTKFCAFLMEIWPKIYSKMVAAAILNFKNAILDSQLPPQIAHIYLHTKSGANRSTIIGRDMPVCVFSKMTAAAILDFKNAIWDFLCPSVCPYLSAHQIWCKTAN